MAYTDCNGETHSWIRYTAGITSTQHPQNRADRGSEEVVHVCSLYVTRTMRFIEANLVAFGQTKVGCSNPLTSNYTQTPAGLGLADVGSSVI